MLRLHIQRRLKAVSFTTLGLSTYGRTRQRDTLPQGRGLVGRPRPQGRARSLIGSLAAPALPLAPNAAGGVT